MIIITQWRIDMSKMLEQAIIDAEALKEAALKNAEQAILEKYSKEVKSAVENLLEQPEEPPAMDLGMDPAPGAAEDAEGDFAQDMPRADTDEDDVCPCPDEEEEIEINFDELAEALRTLNEESSKPDFLDLDKDNNKTESMKSAAASAKKMMKGGRVKKMGGGMSKLNPGLRKFMMAKKKGK